MNFFKINYKVFIIFLFSVLFYFSEFALIARSILLLIILSFLISIEGKTDKIFISYILFSFLYLLNLSFFEEDYFMKSFSLLFPILSYWIGMFYGKFFRNSDTLLNTFLIISLISSSYYILSILIDIYKNGFLGDGRSINLLFDNIGDDAKSATVIGGAFSALTACLSTFFLKKNKFLNIAIVFILTYCCLRIGSRTQIFILIALLFISYLYSINKISLIKKVFYFSAFTSITLYLYFYILLTSDFGFFFQDRLDSNEYGVSSFGGRSEKWGKSIELMLQNPQGWQLSELGYSHNMWLDVYRVGGVLAFLAFLAFTFFLFKRVLLLFRINRDNLLTAFLLGFCFIHFVLFFMEPILDGFIIPFSIFLLFLGLLSSFIFNKKQCNII